MNLIRAAATIALIVAIVATGFLIYYAYENEVLLRHALASFDGPDPENPTLEYLASGGIALVCLITSLTLFGLAKTKEPKG